MDQTAPTAQAPATAGRRSRFRWLWRICFAVILIGFVWGAYLIVTARPALYSPAAVVRKSSYYLQAMNPPTVAPATNAAALPAAPQVKINTNSGKIRIEFPFDSNQKEIPATGIKLHRVNGGETARIGETSFRLKRIGHAWVPPGTNFNNSGYHNNIPAKYYDADLQPIPDAVIVQELKQAWERTMDCRDNRNSYQFEFEILGPDWKFQSLSMFDARTQFRLTDGSSSSSRKDGYRVELEPYLWHQTPVELVADITTGPMEEEEILPQSGSFFTVGPVSYHLIFSGDNLSGNSYSYGSSGNSSHMELQAPTSRPNRKTKECVFVFVGLPLSSQSSFDIDYLDADGKPLKTIGYSRSGSKILQGVEAEVQDVKKIRVRKYTSHHRVIIRLPGLPNLPPANHNLDNLFAIRIPELRFEREYEHEEFIRRITQLETPHLTGPSLPAGTYPRSFTNATVMQVLEDYAHLHGVPGQLHVNQEKLAIEKGVRQWHDEVREKLVKLWEKLRGP